MLSQHMNVNVKTKIRPTDKNEFLIIKVLRDRMSN